MHTTRRIQIFLASLHQNLEILQKYGSKAVCLGTAYMLEHEARMVLDGSN